MARKIKQRGVEWFKIFTDFTQKQSLTIAKHGLELMGLKSAIDHFIAQNDYYYEITEDTYDTLEMFYKINNDNGKIDEMIQTLVDADFYNADIYENYKILTNEAMQEGFAEIGRGRVSSKRKSDAEYQEPLYRELWLIDLKKKAQFFTFISLENNQLIDSSQTVYKQSINCFEQRRGEDRREEDRREEDKRVEDKRGEVSSCKYFAIEEISDHKPKLDFEVQLRSISEKLNNLGLSNQEYLIHKTNIRKLILFFNNAHELYLGEPLSPDTVEFTQYIAEKLIEPVVPIGSDEVILSIDDMELYKKTIKQYFETDMDCDYSLQHFLSGNIRVNAVQDVNRNS